MKRFTSFANRHRVLSSIGIAVGAIIVIGAFSGGSGSSKKNAAPAVSTPAAATAPAASTVSATAAPTAAQIAAKKAAQKAAHRQAVKAAKAARVAARKAKAAAKRAIAHQRALAAIGTPAARQQAIEAAQSYLSMGGFSYAGLIQQLDSSAGNGFTSALATFAVENVQVNWNQQAVDAAKSYMQMGGFSRTSLIQQLDSSAGNGFTLAQATFAANHVGL